jgi:hypothetical protein
LLPFDGTIWLVSAMQVKGKEKQKKTYNNRYSPVVTHPSTNLSVTGLSMGERTGSRVLQYLWSYVIDVRAGELDEVCRERACLGAEPTRRVAGSVGIHVYQSDEVPGKCLFLYTPCWAWERWSDHA